MEDIVEFIVKGAFRVIVYLVKDIVFELLIRWPGYLITRTYSSKSKADIDSVEVFVWGFAFWLIVFFSWMVLFK